MTDFFFKTVFFLNEGKHSDHYTPFGYDSPNKLPTAISIDEFKENTSTGKYRILVDPKKHKILDILPDRTQSHLPDYWRNFPRKERLKV